MTYGWLICSIVLFLTSCDDVHVEKTTGKNITEIEKYLSAHLTSIERSTDKVAFVSDGYLGVRNSDGSWRKEFVLAQGEEFLARPDHHVSMKFMVVHIASNNVLIKYHTTFDKWSFGKNQAISDEGQVELGYK